MTTDDLAALRKQLKRHEGVRLMPYKDTRGLLTIGVGRCIEVRGITADEADYLLMNDIDMCIRGLVKAYVWFADLDPIRQRAMVDLVFNLGAGGLAQFKKFLAAMARTDYEDAAKELQASRWYTQVASRGPRIVEMILGRDPAAA